MKADLHCHTVLSDGAMDVDALLRYAKRINLDYIAISDHESTHSIPAALALGEELGLHVIPAAEVNAYHKETGINVHLLCYYPVDTKRLQRHLDKDLKIFSDSVTKSYQSLMDQYPITMEQLAEASRLSTGVYYTHIMQVLSSMGYTKTPIGSLHDELFYPGSPHKFPYQYMSTTEAVKLIRACGGVVVLAHPGQYKNPMLMEMMIEENLLDGIELNHPRNDERTMDQIQSLCREHDLFMTGGTDFHGLYTKTPYPLGSFLCPQEGLERLIEAGKAANAAYYQHKSEH
ncbi:MAG: PHP domain-containing protein [Anaerostipes sp.]|uniref:PHP domain-containing protein n=1 Tax=Anaerostipes sp. TaxID=1872530 RepID=UPI00399550F6